MKRKSDYVHRSELLITLDYLFKYTDEKHPVTCPLICKYANKYGFIYDSNNKVGNEINRHRISNALDFLYDISTKYKEILPFEIKKTEGRKYYASHRNNFAIPEVVDIISSITTNKVLSSEEKDNLISKVKNMSLSHYENEVADYIEDKTVSVRKYSNEYLTKLRLLKIAFKENKMIHIYFKKKIYSESSDIWIEEKAPIWCRVYKLKEYQNKLYAIFVDVNGVVHSLPIERIELTSYIKREVLIDDDDIDRFNNDYYSSFEEFMKDNKVVIDDAKVAVPFVFIFHKKYLEAIKESFEDFFSLQFQYEYRSFDNLLKEYDEKKLDDFNKDDEIGYCKIKINHHAFLTWVKNNYIVAKEITILSPFGINKRLAFYFSKLNEKYAKYKELV